MAQILVALITIGIGGVILNDLGAIGWNSGNVELGYLAWPLTILAIIMAINAINITLFL